MTATTAIFAVLAIAIVTEGITEYIKMMVPEIADNTRVLLAITVVLGVVTSVAYKADILAAVGVGTDIPYIGNVLTGVLVARGSNYLYDLVGRLTDAENSLKELERPAEENMETEHGPEAETAETKEG